MPTFKNLLPASSWREINTTAEDWNTLDPTLGKTMLVQEHLIRAFEEKVLDLSRIDLIHGPAHSAIGQEGGAVGSVISLIKGDEIDGSHRGHHQFYAKALSYIEPDGVAIDQDFPTAVFDVTKKTLAEIMGLKQGFCRGRGGSMHLRWAEAGNLGTNAIVGGGVPIAAGAAFAIKQAEKNKVVYTYFGDGATNIGSVLETMNLAAAWKLPLCFFIENNRYAVSTNVEEATAETRLSARGLAFAIPALKVDGRDTLAV